MTLAGFALTLLGNALLGLKSDHLWGLLLGSQAVYWGGVIVGAAP